MNCPSCNKRNIGETARRLASRIEENGGKYEQSNVTTHSVDSGHNWVQPCNFKILTHIQSKDVNTRKIAEAHTKVQAHS